MPAALGHPAVLHDEDLVRLLIVDSRCAMTSEVRPASAVFSACCTADSDSESRWAVASSSTTTRGAFSSSLASASRCFSPPDSR